ncbi:MAG: hypothetical protein OXO51_15445 [Gemmatimonadota bacterium]|nr:hypothetical protein [Gemmatimonadota bacterium]
MTQTLDRNEVQEIYGLLDALAQGQADQQKWLKVLSERMGQVEKDVSELKTDVSELKSKMDVIIRRLDIMVQNK